VPEENKVEPSLLSFRYRLNHGTRNYYAGNKIEFIIEIINNSPDTIHHLLYHQTFPDCIVSGDNKHFKVKVNSGKIICDEECVIILFDEIKAQDKIIIIIEGKIDDWQ